jgi:thiamine-phosphate pyrophosphorylase
LHVITDTRIQGRFSHEELARRAAGAGAATVQYRDKTMLDPHLRERTARRMLAALAPHGTLLVVNDHVETAQSAGAHGVHLGASDLPVAEARRVLGASALIGGTANSLEQALRVAALPVDYLGVGPVFGTRSKESPAPRLGLETLRRIAAVVDKPLIAIGGITADRVEAVLAAGAWGVAVLSAVVTAEHPEEETRRFREALEAATTSEVRG